MKRLTDYLQPGTVYFRNRVFGTAEVRAGIDTLARYLEDNLVSSSPFIYLFASNHLKTVLAFFAIIKAHHICVIIDPHIGSLELSEMMQDTPPAASIRIAPGTIEWNFSKEIEIREQPRKKEENDDLGDVCVMIYTAADDGYAKAAMLTHENMLTNGMSVVEVDAINDKSLSCALVRYAHLFGMQTGFIAPFLAGGSILIEAIDDLRRLSDVVTNMCMRKVTNMYSVPVIYYLLSKEKTSQTGKPGIVSYVSGGYKLKSEIFDRFFQWSGREIHEGYGLSEASPICTWHRRNDSIKINSVGRPFPCCSIKTFDDKMNELLPYQCGEICVYGKNIMKGYYANAVANGRTLINGWLRTGDRGHMDSEGFIYLTGLYKKMLNYGGQKIFAGELERLMKLNRQVVTAKIYGVDDWLLGQKIHAKVQLVQNSITAQKTFLSWCRLNISSYKIPAKICFESS